MKALKDIQIRAKALVMAKEVFDSMPEGMASREVTKHSIIVKANGKTVFSAVSPSGQYFAISAHPSIYPANCYWSNEQ